ncbi:MAG: hypothetical protein LBK08_05750 [Treponema sp.]|jgi:uncharacterized membrane protein YciS (DUF1049 family)|nr:hypothetical protein [Treponema sp.]
MPWRLIGFIVLFGVFLAFITLNLGNSSDISFGFRIFPGVPVYLTVFVSFILGMLCTIPVMVSFRLKKKGKLKTREKQPQPDKKGTGGVEELPGADSPYGID